MHYGLFFVPLEPYSSHTCNPNYGPAKETTAGVHKFCTARHQDDLIYSFYYGYAYFISHRSVTVFFLHVTLRNS